MSTPSQGTPRRRAPIADALAVEAPAAGEDVAQARGGRRRRARQMDENIPMVKDAVGETVAESFENFLKT